MGVIEDRIEAFKMIVEDATTVVNDPETKKLRLRLEQVVTGLAEMEGYESSDELVTLFNAAQKARAFLGMETEVDLSAGNEACDKVKAIIAGDLIEGADKDEAISLIDQWNKIKANNRTRKPKVTDPNATPTEPDLAFGTVAVCGECQQIVAEQGKRSGTTRWPFLKQDVKKHHGEHDATLMGDNAAWREAKEAMQAGETEVVVGQYTIKKV